MKHIKIIKNSVPVSEKPYPMSPLRRPVNNAVMEIIAVVARYLFFLLLVGWDLVPCTAATSGLFVPAPDDR
jgi:hypothetical protein